MNNYGQQAMDHWRTVAPARFAEIENPQTFFDQLGERILTRVSELSSSLEGPDLPDETYLQKVGRLRMARLQAEEVVLSELVWIEPELSDEEARAEWEATRPMDEILAQWAWRVQEHPEDVATVEIEDRALAWSLPVEFLDQLLASTNPFDFLTAHASTMRAAADRRFQLEMTQTPE